MPNPRISARQGQPVKLDVTFYRGGVPTDPYAIRKVEIYKTQVLPHNLVATIPLVDPEDTLYPAPVAQAAVLSETGDCGTEPVGPTTPIPGKYELIYDVPAEFEAPDVYFDLWHYYPVNPCESGTDPCDYEDPENLAKVLKCCNRFWLYPDEWFCSDGLQTVNFGFEPLSQKFNQPEVRPLEIGLMPLPLYDYNYNLVNPLIPFLTATISIETQHNELLVESEPMEIGLRQGSYRTNPWVIKYMLDTTKFLKGTYKYRVLLHLPDGSSRSSNDFVLVIR